MTNVKQAAEQIQNISWLPLTPDEIEAQIAYYGRERADYKRYYIDTRLANAFDLINSEAKRRKAGYMFPQEEFSAGLRDRNFTKFQADWSETVEQIKHFADPENDRPDKRWLKANKAAVRLVTNELRKMGLLRPFEIKSEEDCLAVFGDASTSAGFGGRGSKEDNIQTIYSSFKNLKEIARNVNRLDGTLPLDVYVLFHRSQIDDFVRCGRYNPLYKHKNRAIQGASGGYTAFNGQYAKPLIQAMSQHWWNYAGGDTPDELRYKIRTARRKYKCWFQSDFSKFDQTLPAWLLYEAFDIIKSLFPKECQGEIAIIANDFVHSQILLPGGKIFLKHRGIPSGNYFTQVVGSICNALMLLTYLCSLFEGSIEYRMHKVRNMLGAHREYDPMLFLVLGDDSLVFTSIPINLHDMASYLWTVFGVKMNPDKTVTWQEQRWPHFLKRDWTGHGEWRDPLELILGVTHPERERSYDGYSEWHIMYGLKKTFSAAFPRVLTDVWFLKMMENHGGIEALENLEFRDLPGPLKGYGQRGLVKEFIMAEARLEMNRVS